MDKIEYNKTFDPIANMIPECAHPKERQLKLGQYMRYDLIRSVLACELCGFTYELVAKDWW